MKKLITIAATAALLLACTASPTTATDSVRYMNFVGRPDGHGEGVYRICDAGRLIYVYDGYKAGGIAVSDIPCV